MPRPPVDRDDPRTRYTHTAYPVSYGGIAPERGVSGRNMLLAGTPRMAFQFVVPVGVATPIVVGDLPMGLWIDGVINHVALAAGTFSLVLRGVGGGPDHTLVTSINGTLSTAGAKTTSPIWTPTGQTRPLLFTPAGGAPGEIAIISVLATPAETGWK